jgi:hypothetical protein
LFVEAVVDFARIDKVTAFATPDIDAVPIFAIDSEAAIMSVSPARRFSSPSFCCDGDGFPETAFVVFNSPKTLLHERT